MRRTLWQGVAKVGTVLYRIVWKNYPADMIWYEPPDNIGTSWVELYESQIAGDAEEEAADEAEEEELAVLEDEERLPAP